ncbi:DUF937 domain-containing protein [Methylobacterium radiotolerans]|uniref:DUF937 domain-containing protein n=1 Tax=Methylobacterium radiotolerans TaxID=31998 RepID=UPI0033958CAF
MFNPLEMFQAQGEAGLQAMGQPFGLTTEQTARAFEALMPALTLGLQRSVGLDPAGFARMFGLEAAKPAPAQGFEALGQMFGSAQLMQAVLRQASATSGVGAQVLRQMLPMMAGAVVASIVHVMLNQPQAEPARPSAPPPPVPFPFGPAWAEMAKAMMPAVEPPAPPPKPAAKPTAKPAANPAGGRGRGRLRHVPADAAHRCRGSGQQHPGDAGAVRDLLARLRHAVRERRASGPVG